MADSVVDITIRATNEIGATLKQVRADIQRIREAQISLAKEAGGTSSLAAPYEVMATSAGAARTTIQQVEKDVKNLREAHISLQTDATTDTLAGTFQSVAVAANDASAGVAGLDEELHEAFEGLGDTAARASEGVSKLGGEVDKLSGTMPKLIRYLKLAAGGFLAFQSVQTARSFADTAGRAQVLGTVLRTVAANAGIGSGAISKMESEVASLGITTDATRDSLTKLIQAGLIGEATAFRAAELARTAQDLAVTSGQDSSETFRRLITNIQQLDTVGLRYQGIIVDRAAAEKKFLAANRQITGELTKQQQQQALMNAVLEEGTKLTGIYELSMQNVSKQVGSLVRLHKTLSEEIGKTLLPTYQALVDVYSDFIKELIGSAEAFDANEEFAVALGAAVRQVAEALKEFVLILIEYSDVLIALAAAAVFTKIVKGVYALGTAVVRAGTAFTVFRLDMAKTVASMTLVEKASYRVAVAIRAIGVALRFATFFGIFILLAEILVALAEKFPIVGEAARVAFALMKLAIAPILDLLGSVIGRIAGTAAALEALGDFKGPTAALEAYNAEVEKFTGNTERALAGLNEAWAEVGTSQQGAQAELLQEGKDLSDELRAQQLKLIKAKQALSEARSAAAGTTSEALQDEVKKREEEVAALDKEVKEIAKSIKNIAVSLQKEGREALNDYQQDITAEGNKAVLELQEAQAKIDAAEEKLFGKEGFQEEPGITQKFAGLNAALQDLIDVNLEPFTREVNGDSTTISVSLEKVVQGFEALAQAAKTPREIAAALQTIAPVADDVSARVKALRENLEVRLENSTIKELDGIFEGLTSRINELRGAYGLLFDVQSALAADQNQLTTTLLELGATVENAKKGVLGLTNEFSNLAGVSATLTDLKLDPIISQFKELTALYKFDISSLEEQTRRRVELVNEQQAANTAAHDKQIKEIEERIKGGDELTKALQEADKKYVTERDRINKQLEAVDKDSLNKRAALAKGYFDKLRSLRDQSLQQYKDSVNKIKALDDKLKALDEEEDAFNNNIRRRKLTDYQRYQDDIRQIDRLTTEARLANLNKDYALAEELNRKRIELAKGLDQAAGVDKKVSERKATEEVTRAINDQRQVITQQRKEGEESAAKQLAVYKSLTEALNKVAGVVKDIAGEQKTLVLAELDSPSFEAAYAALDELEKPRKSKLFVEVDQTSLNALSNQLKTTLSAGQFAINVTAEAANQAGGFATGGAVRGPGTDTSDSILARLSNNEFVMQAKATKHYGSEFMYAINNLKLPKFNMGGLINTFTPTFSPVYAYPAFAAGGLVTAPAANEKGGKKDLVEILLKTDKGEEVTLMAERRNMQGFVNILQNVEGAR